MSTDYSAVCMDCLRYIHIGQRFTSGWAFGYGSKDEATMKRQGAWLLEHLHPDTADALEPAPSMHVVVVMPDDCVPDGFEADEIGVACTTCGGSMKVGPPDDRDDCPDCIQDGLCAKCGWIRHICRC